MQLRGREDGTGRQADVVQYYRLSEGYVFIIVNAFVHTLMYLYYAATSMSTNCRAAIADPSSSNELAEYKVPEAISISITVIQITQMFIGVFVNTYWTYLYLNNYKYAPCTRSAARYLHGLTSAHQLCMRCSQDDGSLGHLNVWHVLVSLCEVLRQQVLRKGSEEGGERQGWQGRQEAQGAVSFRWARVIFFDE